MIWGCVLIKMNSNKKRPELCGTPTCRLHNLRVVIWVPFRYLIIPTHMMHAVRRRLLHLYVKNKLREYWSTKDIPQRSICSHPQIGKRMGSHTINCGSFYLPCTFLTPTIAKHLPMPQSLFCCNDRLLRIGRYMLSLISLDYSHACISYGFSIQL